MELASNNIKTIIAVIRNMFKYLKQNRRYKKEPIEIEKIKRSNRETDTAKTLII